MAIDRIVTQKQLNYIETLYLYARLEDFITYNSTALDWLLGEVNQTTNKLVTWKDIQNQYDNEKYEYMLQYVHDTMLHNAEYKGTANGRDWYSFPNYRLGIMSYDLAKKSNQFNIEIQYTQSHLFTLDPQLKGLDLPFDGTIDQYDIKRIDITQIVKTPKDYLTNHAFISPYKTIDRLSKNGTDETIYLGHRKNGNVFRMYNKTIELNTDNKDHPIDFKKIELFSDYFGDIENLYTFELELHRKYLKGTFGIEKLSQLEEVYKAYHEIVGSIKIYEDNDKNKHHIKMKHYDRIDTLSFTEYKEFKRIQKKKKRPSKEYLIKRTNTLIERFENSHNVELLNSEKYYIIEQLATRIIGKNITIEITESDEELACNEVYEKIDRLRANQSNELDVEAQRAFKKVAFNPNPFI